MTEPTLPDALKLLAKASKSILAEAEKLDKSNIPELLAFYKRVYDGENILDDLHKIISGVKDKLSYETIPDTFESMGVDSIKGKGGNFIVGTRFNASIPFPKREAGYAWLRENGFSALITPTVNSKSLSSAIKEHIETTAVEPPEDCITIHRQRYTTIRKN